MLCPRTVIESRPSMRRARSALRGIAGSMPVGRPSATGSAVVTSVATATRAVILMPSLETGQGVLLVVVFPSIERGDRLMVVLIRGSVDRGQLGARRGPSAHRRRGEWPAFVGELIRTGARVGSLEQSTFVA